MTPRPWNPASTVFVPAAWNGPTFRADSTATPKGNDELQMRSFWRRWQSLVAGLPHVEQFERGLALGEKPEVAPSPELAVAAD